ncbi:hypothetical protein JMUB6875_41340 [Nocardia sp. JMUB6875]|uniref:hypothetical protein n=1 Tax=Nocardia sp. JMUB6875 TaxID=3158170 RepID=UPI0032E6BE33
MALTSYDAFQALRVIISNTATNRLGASEIEADMHLDAAGDRSEVVPLIVMMMEDHFDISISDEEASNFRTVADLIDFIVKRVN